MSREAAFLLSLALSSQKKEENNMVREDYDIIWDPQKVTATGGFQNFTWRFPDKKIRYLRHVSVQDQQNTIEVNIILTERPDGGADTDAYIHTEPTKKFLSTSLSTMMSWNGDIPMKGKLKLNCYSVVALDVLIAVIMYEEKIE